MERQTQTTILMSQSSRFNTPSKLIKHNEVPDVDRVVQLGSCTNTQCLCSFSFGETIRSISLQQQSLIWDLYLPELIAKLHSLMLAYQLRQLDK